MIHKSSSMTVNAKQKYTVVAATIIAIFFCPQLMAIRCYEMSLSNATRVNVTRVSELDGENHQRYKFEFSFPFTCGHRSSITNYPQKKVIKKLIAQHWPNKITSINRKITRDRATFSFTARRSSLDGHLIYDENVSLSYKFKYITMENFSTIKPAMAMGPFWGLREITWQDKCQQESAGWCLTDTMFSFVWELKEGETIGAVEENIKVTIAPKIFQETYLRYAEFVHQIAYEDKRK